MNSFTLRVTECVLILGFLSVAVWRVLVWNASQERPPNDMPGVASVPDLIEPGTIVDSDVLPPVPERGTTFVLFMNTTCPFSDADVPFYRDVSAWARSSADAHFVVVSDESPDDIRSWLEKHDLIVSHVVGGPRVTDLASLGVFGTPTVAVIADDRVVTDLWVGEMKPPQEELFVAMLSTGLRGLMGNLRDPPLVASEDVVERRANDQDVVVLDIRGRLQYESPQDLQTVNIPLDELGIRAPIELPMSGNVFVDCRVGWLPDCRHAARGLAFDGFDRVAVIVR